MKFAQLNTSLVRRAVELYLEHAWPGAGAHPTLDLAPVREAADLDAQLACFEASCDMTGRLERYTLRLGNAGYPFMKFVVQEHLIDGEYFFSVDTHDNLDIRPDNPEYARWEELKAANRALKAEIERAWNDEGLPTNRDLRRMMERLAEVETEDEKRKRILLVDDEAPVALGIAACLRGRGYEVDVAPNGRRALELMHAGAIPDLVLLDFEMPELDGQAVLTRMRNDPRTEDVPVLMATASEIELSRLTRVSGFLQKPYPREVLFAMIASLLGGRREGDPGARGVGPGAREGASGNRTAERGRTGG